MPQYGIIILIKTVQDLAILKSMGQNNYCFTIFFLTIELFDR